MMQRYKLSLNICTCSQFECRTNYNSYIAVINRLKKHFAFSFCFVIMHKRNFLFPYSATYAQSFQLVIYIERVLRHRCVTENNLCTFVCHCIKIYFLHILKTSVNLAVSTERQTAVNKSHVKSRFSSVSCDLKHIVFFSRYFMVTYPLYTRGYIIKKTLKFRCFSDYAVFISLHLRYLVLIIKLMKIRHISEKKCQLCEIMKPAYS